MKTRERIIDKALELFNERGIGEVGVREIARALNISVGNLSYHFPKKEDIILELFGRLSQANDTAYQAYNDEAPSLPRFLETMRTVLNNQYRFRGVLVGRLEINKIFRAHYDYASVEKRRKEFIRSIFQGLHDSGDLQLSPDHIEFLVSFMTLFARFWIMEAFVSFPDWSQEKVIDYYIRLLEQELELFRS